MQKRFAVVLLCGLSLAWFASTFQLASRSLAQTQLPQSSATWLGCDPLDELNARIQERFNKFDGAFGFARVSHLVSNAHFFALRLENNQEQAVVAALQQAGWRVAFYLASRRVLEPMPEYLDPTGKLQPYFRVGLKGPVPITPVKELPAWPNQSEFRAQTQKALAAFAKQDRYDFALNSINYSARPIRAQETCLQCHNNKPEDPKELTSNNVIPIRRGNPHAYSKTPLKIGDALGAAIYAYVKINQ